LSKFAVFIRERKFLHNVSPATVSWYTHALKWLPSEAPTQTELKETVLRMRELGLKETGCNAAIRAINAYLHWASDNERKCGPGCTHPRMSRLKEPENILPALTEAEVRAIVAWKPRAGNYHERRVHLLALLLLDTGCRISEALAVRIADIDLDNLLIKLNGKGSKQRLVPFSFSLRRVICRFIKDFTRQPEALLISTREGGPVRRISALRSVQRLCVSLGFTPPSRTLHAFRHTFALNYLRRGGSVFHLQKVLGHSSLEMTRRYANLSTADLQAAHEKVTLLTK